MGASSWRSQGFGQRLRSLVCRILKLELGSDQRPRRSPHLAPHVSHPSGDINAFRRFGRPAEGVSRLAVGSALEKLKKPVLNKSTTGRQNVPVTVEVLMVLE